MQTAAPFRIDPRFDKRVWGYRDLRPWFDKVASEEPLGEAWLTGDDCLIATGPHQGQTLVSVFRESPDVMLGPHPAGCESPLLIKVLFPADKLSVQVHPDDRLARMCGQPRGKTECWYALDAKPGAQVAVGLKPGVTLDQVRHGIESGTLEQSVNVLPVAKGDMIFVDAGTVHAIWPGAILLETQQNCDITYRMYDYGRPRELHVEKSLEATRLTTRAGKVAPKPAPGRTILIDVEYFRVEHIPVQGSVTSPALAGDAAMPTLSYLFAASGEAVLRGEGFDPVHLPPRGIVAVPAASVGFTLEAPGGVDLIRITPNWPERAQ